MNDDNGSGRLLHASGAYLGGAGSEVRWMGETCTRFLATGRSTNDQFALVDETAKRGEAIPLHRHSEDVESFYVLDGEMTFFIDDQPGISARAGMFLHVPAGTIHGFRIASDTARYLILTTPRHGEFYRAISVPAGADGLPASHDVDWDKVMATAEEYGIELLGDLPEGLCRLRDDDGLKSILALSPSYEIRARGKGKSAVAPVLSKVKSCEIACVRSVRKASSTWKRHSWMDAFPRS